MKPRVIVQPLKGDLVRLVQGTQDGLQDITDTFWPTPWLIGLKSKKSKWEQEEFCIQHSGLPEAKFLLYEL